MLNLGRNLFFILHQFNSNFYGWCTALFKKQQKKEVRGKKPQQEVDLGSKSAAAPSGGLCGSSGILNMWVNEVEKDGEKRLRGETGAVQLGEEPEQEPEAAGAEVNWRVSLFH